MQQPLSAPTTKLQFTISIDYVESSFATLGRKVDGAAFSLGHRSAPVHIGVAEAQRLPLGRHDPLRGLPRSPTYNGGNRMT